MMIYLALVAGAFLVMHVMPHLYRPTAVGNLQDYAINKFLQILFVIAVYATIKTGGQSVMMILFVPVLLVTIGLIQGANYQITLVPSRRTICPLLIFAGAGVIISLVQYYFITSAETGQINVSNRDYVYYSSIAQSLIETGIETTALSASWGQGVHPTPYHFFQPWLSALFVELTGLPAYAVLYLVTFAILRALIIVAFYTFISKKLPRAVSVVFSVVALSAAGIYIEPLYGKYEILGSAINLVWENLTVPKILPIYVSVAFFLIVRDSARNQLHSVSALSVMPVVYAPSVFGYLGFAAFLIAAEYRARRDVIHATKLAAIALAPVVLLGLFYSQFPSSHTAQLGSTAGDAIRALKIMVGSALVITLLFVPYLLLYAFSRKPNPHDPALDLDTLVPSAIAGLVSAVVGWIIFMHNPNGAQALAVYVPVFALFLFLSIILSRRVAVGLLLASMVAVNVLQFQWFSSDFQRFNFRDKNSEAELLEFRAVIGDLRRAGVVMGRSFASDNFYNFDTHHPFQALKAYDNSYKFFDLGREKEGSGLSSDYQLPILERAVQCDVQFIISCLECELPPEVFEKFPIRRRLKGWVISLRN